MAVSDSQLWNIWWIVIYVLRTFYKCKISTIKLLFHKRIINQNQKKLHLQQRRSKRIVKNYHKLKIFSISWQKLYKYYYNTPNFKPINHTWKLIWIWLNNLISNNSIKGLCEAIVMIYYTTNQKIPLNFFQIIIKENFLSAATDNECVHT